jgi:hypothetical protein
MSAEKPKAIAREELWWPFIGRALVAPDAPQPASFQYLFESTFAQAMKLPPAQRPITSLTDDLLALEADKQIVIDDQGSFELSPEAEAAAQHLPELTSVANGTALSRFGTNVTDFAAVFSSRSQKSNY